MIKAILVGIIFLILFSLPLLALACILDEPEEQLWDLEDDEMSF